MQSFLVLILFFRKTDDGEMAELAAFYMIRQNFFYIFRHDIYPTRVIGSFKQA